MKNQIISTSSTRKLCLMTFILLCSLFTSNNAFSLKWDHHDMGVFAFPKENYILMKFKFFEYAPEHVDVHSYMQTFNLLYSEDGTHFYPFLNAVTLRQTQKTGKRFFKIMSRINPEEFEFVGADWDKRQPKERWYKETEDEYKEGKVVKKHIITTATIKWTLPIAIRFIRIVGTWVIDNTETSKIFETYIIPYYKSNAPKDNTSSELSNDEKVIVNADEITVTGVKPGERIKVFTTTGVEVKSVVANDDVVNIKLTTNQNYVVKIGERSIQVSL